MPDRRRLLLGCLSVAVCQCARDEPWRAIDSPEGRFSVSMPVRPRTGDQKANSGWGLLDVRFYEAEVKDGAAVYSVTYTDYPFETVEPEKARALLLDAQRSTLQQVSGQMLSQGATTWQGYPARRTAIRAASGVEYDLLVVLAASRLYQVSTASRPGQLSARDKRAFFDSFRIR